MAFNAKCNLLDTVQGTVIINLAGMMLSQAGWVKLGWVFKTIDALSLIFDAADIGFQVQSVARHRYDEYEYGMFAGKAIKLGIMAYLQGWIGDVLYAIERITDTKKCSEQSSRSL
jgi:hypothetical protein